jgi:membrane peptidoglycan carboxypeptidase
MAGLRITTTINPKAQQMLEKTADGESAGSLMSAQPKTLQAAAVAIEPGTGRVLAYFGGHDGTGADYAGIFAGENDTVNGLGGHPPGGAFQAVTLAAALKAGISLRSKWNAAPHEQQGRPTANPIRNTGRCPTGQDVCTLVDSTAVGLETTFYDVTLSISPTKVLELARDAGIDAMWTDDRRRIPLVGTPDMGTLTPRDFDIVLGLGQYPVTVVDEANVMATFAAGGQRSKVHFVTQVRQGHNLVSPEELPSLTQPKIFPPAVSADLDYALSQNRALALPDMASAGKTGNWQFNNSSVQVSHAWATGYTTSLAFAVWIGNRDKETPLEDRTGATIFGSGLPADIYRAFMTAAHPALSLKPQPFPAPTFGGTLNPPLALPS